MIVFLLLVAGCAELPSASYADGRLERSAVPTPSAAATEIPESSEKEPVVNEEIDPNALRICLDVGQGLAYTERDLTVLELKIADAIKMADGPENIIFDSIPLEGSEREIALERIRTEIMAGEGPDVFIMTAKMVDALFPIPEKAMQEGIFLTLDHYIQNAELGDWDNLTQPVLEAGRTEEGQQLVPMLYTLPVTVYPKESVPEIPPVGTTWQDMLADESGILRRAALMHRFESGGLEMLSEDSVLSVLGELVNYETDEILFSEEDLLHVMKALLTLEEEIDTEGVAGLPEYFQGRLNRLPMLTLRSEKVLSMNRETPVTMIPIYSMNGDVLATVRAYTGINRNTKHPKEAFFVVDYLMSTQAQQTLKLFHGFDGLPINEKVLSEEYPQRDGGDLYLIDENFEALGNIRNQISKVYFDNSLLRAIRSPYYTGQGIQSGEITDQTLEGLVSETYDALKQILGE